MIEQRGQLLLGKYCQANKIRARCQLNLDTLKINQLKAVGVYEMLIFTRRSRFISALNSQPPAHPEILA